MGKKLYISGLVAISDRVRRMLAQPLDEGELEKLKQYIRDTRRQLDLIVQRNGATPSDLPAPSRRAYSFLCSLDLDALPCRAEGSPRVAAVGPLPDSVGLPGLTSFVDRVAGALGAPAPTGAHDHLLTGLEEGGAYYRSELARLNLQLAQLTPPSRRAYRWLQFLSARENFAAYEAAVARAYPALANAALQGHRAGSRLWIEFRPMSALYRAKPTSAGLRLVLHIPMITFDEALFADLARMIFRRGPKRPVLDAAHGEAYQTLQAEFTALDPAFEQTAGVYHDLAASFARVCREHFEDQLPRPRLTWNRTLTHHKFGHYDFLTDTVMVSRSLDHPKVPQYVLDFVMYHELLHKQLGIRWQNDRRNAHTAEFRAAERRYLRFTEAELALKKLAQSHHAGRS